MEKQARQADRHAWPAPTYTPSDFAGLLRIRVLPPPCSSASCDFALGTVGTPGTPAQDFYFASGDRQFRFRGQGTRTWSASGGFCRACCHSLRRRGLAPRSIRKCAPTCAPFAQSHPKKKPLTRWISGQVEQGGFTSGRRGGPGPARRTLPRRCRRDLETIGRRRA